VIHVPVLEACRCLRGAHLQGQVGAGPSSTMRSCGAVPATMWTLDGREGAVLSCGALDGRGLRFHMLVLVGNGMKRVRCDAVTGARELRPDAGLGPDVHALTSLYGFWQNQLISRTYTSY
jgi:hypothetical protein